MFKKFLLLFLFPVALVLGLLASLAGTETGTRFLVGQAVHWSGGALEVARSEGRLLGRLVLSGIRFRQGETHLDAAALTLAWDPRALGAGTLDLETLHLVGVRLALPAEEPGPAPPDEAPLTLPQIRLPLEVTVRDLRVTDLEFRAGEAAPRRLERLTLAARARGDALELTRLEIDLPGARVQAEGRAGLRPPHTLDLAAHWGADLPDGREGSGTLRIRGDLNRLSVRHEGGGALPLDLEAEVIHPLDEPRWSGRIQWRDLLLPLPEGGEPLTLAAGHIETEGRPTAYRIALDLGHRGGGLPGARWAGALRGDLKGLEIDRLQVRSDRGTLALTGGLAWADAPAALLDYALTGLDLGDLVPDLPPNLSAAGRIEARQTNGVIHLDRLTLALADLPTHLEAAGTVRLPPGAEPAIEGRVAWEGVRWPLAAPSLESPAGSLELTGTPANYRLALDTRLSAGTVPEGRWRLDARGDGERLEIERIAGEWLDGRIEGAGHLAWAPRLAGRLGLNIAGLQPHALAATWPQDAAVAGTLEVSIDDRLVRVQRLEVTVPSEAMALSAAAEVHLGKAADDTRIASDIHWSGLRWPLGLADPQAASPEGRLRLTGTVAAYRLELDARAAGGGIPEATLAAVALGDPAGLRFESLRADFLGGVLQGTGTLGWAPHPVWDLALEGRDLDPGRWDPGLPGRLALRLKSVGALDPAKGLSGRLELERLDGRLLDRPLAAAARVAVEGEALEIGELELRSGGNRLAARGALAPERLDLTWSLEAPDPGGLLPGASGRLTAEGRLSGTAGTPGVEVRVQGRDLGRGELRLGRIDGRLKAGPSERDPLELRIELKDLVQGGISQVRQALLKGSGTLAGHRLELDADTRAGRLDAALAGGLDLGGGRWSGGLKRLRADSPDLGAWSLEQEAALTLSAAESALGRACLRREGQAARLCAGGNWKQGAGALEAALTELPLALLHPDVTGTLGGEVRGALAPSGALSGRAGFRVSPGQVRVRLEDGERRLAHRGGSLEATLGPGGLEAALNLEPLEQGRVQGRIALPTLTRLPVPERLPVSGRLEAALPQLGVVQLLVPELKEVTGRLDLDLALSGELPAPRLAGGLRLRDAGASVPLAGLQIRDLGLELTPDPADPQRLRLSGGLASGPGQVRLDGTLDLAALTADLTLKGERLEVLDTPDARALVSPDLVFRWAEDILRVRGRVVIPEASVTPRIALAPGSTGSEEPQPDAPGRAVLPTGDLVVVRGADGKPPQAKPPAAPALALDSRVELVLGDAVRVDAVGFKARFAGAVTLVNAPGQADALPRGEGTVSILDGTFRDFGQDLEIEWGRVVFDKTPVDDPELDIRAVRWIKGDDRVQAAGVQIGGRASQPSLELFSRPPLDDAAVQSYLLTGRAPDSEEQLLAVGTRVHPDLYVGYGINLLQGTHEFNLRYDITLGLGLEADVGEADKSITFSYTLER